MKKLIAMLLALVLVLGLAACGAKNDTPATTETTTLNVAYMANWGSLWAVATADAKGYLQKRASPSS